MGLSWEESGYLRECRWFSRDGLGRGTSFGMGLGAFGCLFAGLLRVVWGGAKGIGLIKKGYTYIYIYRAGVTSISVFDRNICDCQNGNYQIISGVVKKCYIALKKVPKIFAGSKKVATFATAIENENALSCEKQGSEKVLKKVYKLFGDLKNLPYLCTCFRLKTKAGF